MNSPVWVKRKDFMEEYSREEGAKILAEKIKAGEKVNHPSHYNQGRIEVIDFIEDQKLNFSRGSAIKYISRAGKKPGESEVDDLQKAAWYISRELERLTKEQTK